MATLARVQVEDGLDRAPAGSRLWLIHAVAAVVVTVIAAVAIAIDAPGAVFASVVAGVFMAFSAGFWFAERQR